MANLTNNPLKEVAVLQNFGRPFSTLYVDVENRLLYLLVRSDRNAIGIDKFTATPVSPEEVEEYINEGKGLNDLFHSRSLYSVLISGSDIRLENRPPLEEYFDNSVNYFDPEFFFDDEIWIETFLNRVKKGKPLEIH